MGIVDCSDSSRDNASVVPPTPGRWQGEAEGLSLALAAKSKGSAQDNINLATFENEHFSFPTLDEQNRIVVKLNKLSTETIKLKAIYQKNLTALFELKQSILQKTFSGELTAQPDQALKEAVA